MDKSTDAPSSEPLLDITSPDFTEGYIAIMPFSEWTFEGKWQFVSTQEPNVFHARKLG